MNQLLKSDRYITTIQHNAIAEKKKMFMQSQPLIHTIAQ